MATDLHTAAKLALEALDGLEALLLSMGLTHLIVYGDAEKAITNLQKALANEALERMADNARELGLDYEPAQQEPVALKWQQAPVKTQWGDEMVVASVAIDNDHTVCLYCERDQTSKVDAMFAQRTWVGLTIEDKKAYISQDFGGSRTDAMDWAEKRLMEKNA
jgi:ABC-type bacteriocin/lantibiotic exporter with double-glycine peptidase domain